MIFSFKTKAKSKESLIKIESSVNSNKKKFALVIYIPWAIRAWQENNYKEKNFNSHSMHWESIEMVKILTSLGYNVDVADCTGLILQVEWTKYQLVIDERNNLKDAPKVLDQIQIHYATGCQWLFHNAAEYIRLFDFKSRTGISTDPARQVSPVYSEEIAGITTYFGGEFQRDLFTHPYKTFPLSLSSSYIPEFKEKELSASRKNILWLGSRGFIHKGLDIVLEAFKEVNNFNLHICTKLEAEPQFYNWYKTKFSNCSNIFYHGWMDVNELQFKQLAENCIASVYCSAAEGGAGAVVQAMQFGCIPIVNDSTALRGQHTGFFLNGQSPKELINSIRQVLKNMGDMSAQELAEKSATVRSYANLHHSRTAYSNSFKQLIMDTTIG